MGVVNPPKDNFFKAPYFPSEGVLLEVWGHAGSFYSEVMPLDSLKGHVTVHHNRLCIPFYRGHWLEPKEFGPLIL